MAEQENKARKRDGKTGASRTSLKCSPCQQEHKHTTPNEQQRSFDVIVEECEENAMQKRMIRHVVVALRKRNQPLILLNGNPGSGKTYTTLRITTEYRSQPEAVTGLLPSTARCLNNELSSRRYLQIPNSRPQLPRPKAGIFGLSCSRFTRRYWGNPC